MGFGLCPISMLWVYLSGSSVSVYVPISVYLSVRVCGRARARVCV